MTHKLNILFVFFALGTPFNSSFSTKDENYTLADHNLARIIKTQNAFFNYSNNRSETNENELTRIAQEIVSAYEIHIAENPKDVNALILFGKFLQKVGQNDEAIDLFLQADLLDPKLAVVKQQMANYLIKEKRIIDAFPFLLMTVQISPSEAIYHFDVGNFLHHFLEDLEKEEILDRESGQSLMLKSFQKASNLSPNSFDYALRYAQAYFDCPMASRNDALVAWNAILKNFTKLTKKEIDYVKLCKARILIEIGNKPEAKRLIGSVTTESLKSAKLSLLKQTVEKQINSQSEKHNEKKDVDVQKTGFRFPTDMHLQRMRSVSLRLREEMLLSYLKLDVLRAKLDGKGGIKVELSRTAID